MKGIGLTIKDLKHFDWRYAEDDDSNYMRIIKSNLKVIRKDINRFGAELLGGAVAGQLVDEELDIKDYFSLMGFDNIFANNMSIYNRYIKAYTYFLVQQKDVVYYPYTQRLVLERLRFLRDLEMVEIYNFLSMGEGKLEIYTNEHERITRIEMESKNDELIDVILTNMDMVDDLLLAIESGNEQEISSKLLKFTPGEIKKTVGIYKFAEDDPFGDL